MLDSKVLCVVADAIKCSVSWWNYSPRLHYNLTVWILPLTYEGRRFINHNVSVHCLCLCLKLLKHPCGKPESKAELWDILQSCGSMLTAVVFIVGIHASISAHVVNEYLLDERAGQWGQNFSEFQSRLGHEGVKERIENLYFAYLFVLRAVVKAGDYLKQVEFTTGFQEDDVRTLQLVQNLVRNCSLQKLFFAALICLSCCYMEGCSNYIFAIWQPWNTVKEAF